MVTVMESWFLADRQVLFEFFGQELQESALPRNPQVEQVPKDQVLDGLARASRRTSKGEYHKGNHSFRILGQIDPGKAEDAAPFASRFFSTLRRRLGALH
jgi:hypothetical protein